MDGRERGRDGDLQVDPARAAADGGAALSEEGGGHPHLETRPAALAVDVHRLRAVVARAVDVTARDGVDVGRRVASRPPRSAAAASLMFDPEVAWRFGPMRARVGIDIGASVASGRRADGFCGSRRTE